jgi:hypothetical protein
MKFEDLSDVATDLKLFVESDSSIYHRMTQPILKNLATKKVQGKYSKTGANKNFMSLAEFGAKQYLKEFPEPGKLWNLRFPIQDRRAVADCWVEEFEVEYKLGNYDNFLPKKYQKK